MLHYLFNFLAISCFLAPLIAQVTPAPASCSMGHCNPQMTDYVPQAPPGTNGSVHVVRNDPWNAGVGFGDGCVANGTYAVCAYDQSWNALVAYDGDGNTMWGSGDLLDNQTFAGMPIIQADGSVVAADDQHLYKFNPDGSVTWVTPTPGGVPIGLVPTPNGAIVIGTAGRQIERCWQANCTLSFTVNNGGSGYTTAFVMLAGGDCPGGAAQATISGGVVTSITAISQGPGCDVAPGVIVVGDGSGASATAVLLAAAPVAVYSGTTGALLGSRILYQHGGSGAYYATINTACVNNGSHPNRLYILANLAGDTTQGALWALDIDPANLANPISPAWSVAFHGPSGASPLCVGDHVYFDGAGIMQGDRTGTTIFGVADNGDSGSFLFQVPLGAGSMNITCNFALDPRPIGGFWHQLKYDPNIYHRDFNTGALIETVNVSDFLIAAGAPPSTYWQAGVFTTYGTPDHPYLILPEAANPQSGGYIAMLDLSSQKLVWAVPLAGNDQTRYDTPGGDAVLLHNSSGNPVLVVSGKETGAYFITDGGASTLLSATSLSFGTEIVGSASGAQDITVTNSASLPLTFSAIKVSGPFLASSNCGNNLSPGNNCTITVTFSPTAAGSQTGSLTISSNSAASPQTVALSGIGTVAAPALALSVKQVSFPAQPAGTISPPQAVTVSNPGKVALNITSIVVSGAAAESNDCPTNLPPGRACTINVMLAAPLQGACNGTVTVSGNNPDGPNRISLKGACVATPDLESALSISSLVFPPESPGTVSPEQTVTLTNTGTAALSISSITAAGDVRETNTCSKLVPVAAQCYISISFLPAATGPRSGTVTVIDAAADSPHVIFISGLGMPNPVPVVNQPLLPASVAPGGQGLTVRVNGSAFVPGSLVYWNGAPRTTRYVSRSQLSASLTAKDVAVPATGGVSVVNPGPGGGQSNTVWLPVVYLSPAPVLAATVLPGGAGPTFLAVADLNGDGRLDLVATNSIDGTVSVFLGNGDGTFAAHVDYPTGNQPAGVAVGDLNHDGVLDLVVANQADNTVSVLLGAGRSFGTPTVYATGNGPVSVVVADLNGDGNLDLAVANLADNTVSVLPGNGDGTFAPRVDYAAGQRPRTLIAADFNTDGKLDLAVGNDFTPGGTVCVLLNHGDGSFLPGAVYATGDSTSLLAADLNGDGKLDLATANELAQTLSVYVGNGDGTFTLGPYQTTVLSPNPVGLALADLDGDGSLEFAVASNSGDGLMTLRNNNAVSILPNMQYGTGTGVAALALGDFNNDGSIDMVVAQPGSNQILVLLQSPAAALSSASLSFGSTPVGGSAAETVTLTNSGSAVLNVVSVSAGGVYSETNDCGANIAPGKSCTVVVTFKPTDTSTQNGTLTIVDNVPGGPQTVGLSGSGTGLGVAMDLTLNLVIGGDTITANTITLGKPAPAGGATVYLSSSNPGLVHMPPSVTIPEGAASSAPFTIVTRAVASNTPVTLTASLGSATFTTTLTIAPMGLVLSLPSTDVYGGTLLTANNVTLTTPAPSGGLLFNLSTSNPAIATVTASVTVAAGTTVSPQFTITTAAVASITTFTLYASLSSVAGTMASATFTIYPARLSSLILSAASVTAGLSTNANTVSLVGLAPPGGATISLYSYRPKLVSVPPAVIVTGNSSVSVPFKISTAYVSTTTQVTIQASYLGMTVTSILTVWPDGVASIDLTSASIVGGAPAIRANTVTLISPAPATGAQVSLSSSSPSVVVPASVTVPAGATISRAFTITTTMVTTRVPVVISATYNNITSSVTLMLNP